MIYDIGITAAVLTGVFFAFSWILSRTDVVRAMSKDQEYEDELDEEFAGED